MNASTSSPATAPAETPLAIRPAVAAEAAELAALVNSAYRGETSKAGWTTEADLLGGQRTDPDGLALLLQESPANGQVVLVQANDTGLLCSVHLERLADGKAYLGMLTVRPLAQAGGIGRRLLGAAEAWAAREWQTREMQMTVIAQRPELIAWYERRGYRATGETRPFPYADERFGLPKRQDLYFRVFAKVLEPNAA